MRNNTSGLPKLFITLSVIAALGGCAAVGPDFEPPDVPKVDNWLEKEDTQVKTDRAAVSDWWTVFNDPILTTLVNTAFDQNLTLQIAGLRILESRAQLGIAKGTLYPQTQQASASAAKNKISENSPNFNPGAEDSFAQYEFGFDAAWELDFWGRFRRGVEAADASLAASISDYQDALVTLTAEVARVYVTIRTFEERIKLAKGNITLQERSLNIAQVRFKNGATTELDVLQAKSNLTNTQALLPTLIRGLRQAKNALNSLLGKPPGVIDALLGDPADIPIAPADVAIGIPAELLRRRPDVRRAEFSAAAQSASIGIAKADLYPSFTLFGSIGFQTSDTGNSDLGDIVSSDSLTSSFGPGFKWNIFNYGRIKNNVRAQDARFQQAIVNYENIVLRAYQETEDSLVSFLQTQREAKFRNDSTVAAQRSTELANFQYREGAVDFQRVIDTERFLVDQQDRLTVARGNIILSLIATYKALGGGWQAANDRAIVPTSIQNTMRKRTDCGDILPPSDIPNTAEIPKPASKQPLFPSIP